MVWVQSISPRPQVNNFSCDTVPLSHGTPRPTVTRTLPKSAPTRRAASPIQSTNGKLLSNLHPSPSANFLLSVSWIGKSSWVYSFSVATSAFLLLTQWDASATFSDVTRALVFSTLRDAYSFRFN